MRSSLLLASLVALAAAGCAKTDTTRVCRPLLSWASPTYACSVAVPMIAEPEPEPEPVEEPEPEEPEEPEPERVTVKEEKLDLTDKVNFETDSAKLLPESEELLSEVAKALEDHPEILRIQIGGHTDARAGKRYNKGLSKERASSVRQYLIDHGIAGRRLVAKGFGETKPLGSNKTDEGREKNRRVEFKILKRK